MRPLLAAAVFAGLAASFPLPAAAQVEERPALNVLARGPLVSLDPIAQPSYAALDQWDPLESTCRHASLSIL